MMNMAGNPNKNAELIDCPKALSLRVDKHHHPLPTKVFLEKKLSC